jgi:hypothetical protein
MEDGVVVFMCIVGLVCVEKFLDVVVEIERHSARAVPASGEEGEGFSEGVVVGLHLRGKMLS